MFRLCHTDKSQMLFAGQIPATDVPPFDGHFGENMLTSCVPESLLLFISTVLEGRGRDTPQVNYMEGMGA